MIYLDVVFERTWPAGSCRACTRALCARQRCFFRQMDLVWNNLQVVVMRHLRTWANLQGQLSLEYEKDAKCRVWQNGARNPQLLLGEKKSQELLDAFGLNDPNFWVMILDMDKS